MLPGTDEEADTGRLALFSGLVFASPGADEADASFGASSDVEGVVGVEGRESGDCAPVLGDAESAPPPEPAASVVEELGRPVEAAGVRALALPFAADAELRVVAGDNVRAEALLDLLADLLALVLRGMLHRSAAAFVD